MSLRSRKTSLRRFSRRGPQHTEVALRLRIAELEAALRAQRAHHQPQLNALVSIGIQLLITHEALPILQMATEAALQLFPRASGASAFLADEAEQLVLRAADGAATEPVAFMRTDSIPGLAYLAPRPILVGGPEIEAMLDELQPAQQQVLTGVLQPFPPSSAIFTPLRIETRRIGALIIHGGSSAHLFLPRDLPFAQALANLVAVALAEALGRERAAVLQDALQATETLHAEATARLSVAEAQLLQSAKLAAVGELAASVAHEINNPLYAARNSLYLVDQDLPPEAPQRAFLDIAQSELARIAKIVSRMRDFYRPTRDELEETEINTQIEDTLDLVQTHLRRGQIRIHSQLDPAVPTIIGHADQIRQVFLNLMINACDAMPEGGDLHVTTTLLPKTGEQPSMIKITVADTGQGIPSEHLARIFEAFYTTKAHGTGLGLAISAHIITQHNGQIRVSSQLGKGTMFTILLPLSMPER